MNEQIKELYVQAIQYADSVVPKHDRYNDIYYSIVSGKHAELIVGECAKIVEDSTWNLPHGYKTVDQANLVKQHFGVKK
jgi:hypothetical protein